MIIRLDSSIYLNIEHFMKSANNHGLEATHLVQILDYVINCIR